MLILLKLSAFLLAIWGIYIIGRSEELDEKRLGNSAKIEDEGFLDSLGLPVSLLGTRLTKMRNWLADYLFIEEESQAPAPQPRTIQKEVKAPSHKTAQKSAIKADTNRQQVPKNQQNTETTSPLSFIPKEQKKASISPLNFFKSIGRSFKRLNDILVPDPNAKRNQQMMALSSGFEERSEQEKLVDRALRITTFGLLWVGASIAFAPLMIIGIGSMVYGLLPIYREAYNDIFVDRKLRSSILAAGFLTGVLWSGFYTIGLICLWIRLFSHRLLASVEDNTKSGMVSLFVEQPNTVLQATDDGQEREVSIDEIKAGDILIVSSGQMIPVDGIVQMGTASVDQHRLTGESAPVEKGEGDEVFASTLVLSGRIHLSVERSGQDTVAMKVVTALESTADFKSGLQSKGEAFADSFVLPMVLGSLALWPLMGLHAAVAVLASTPGFNMKLFGPISLLSYLTMAAEEGILIKDGRAIERIEDVDTIVFDKTGTLTVEEPTVDTITTVAHYDEADILTYAVTAEQEQSHPIARAIMEEAQERGLNPSPIIGSRVALGFGLEIEIEDGTLLVGSHRFMTQEDITIAPSLETAHLAGQEIGQTVIFIALNGQAIGTIALRSTLRDGVIEAVEALQARGLQLYILSGDAEAPTRYLAQEVGIEHYFAETLPEDKADVIKKLTAEGKKVCFMGDGINDSIAMKEAHVAISLRGATTLATDTAQVILMEGNLSQLNTLFDLVDRHSRNMKENFLLSTVPSFMSAAIIVFFGGGIISGYFFLTTGLLGGIANALLPALKHQQGQNKLTASGDVIDVDFTTNDALEANINIKSGEAQAHQETHERQAS